MHVYQSDASWYGEASVMSSACLDVDRCADALGIWLQKGSPFEGTCR